MLSSGRQRVRARRALIAPVLAAASLGGLALADAPTPAATHPLLRVEPAHVPQGKTVVLHGSGFAPRAHVTLLAARRHHRARRLGRAVAGRDGSFDAPIRIAAHAALGRYLTTACADRCRQMARTRFRVVRP